MDLDEIQDAQLSLLQHPQPCVLPVTLPPALLDEILADANISMRLEFSENGHVRDVDIILIPGRNVLSKAS
jgi:hypothetical protein